MGRGAAAGASGFPASASAASASAAASLAAGGKYVPPNRRFSGGERMGGGGGGGGGRDRDDPPTIRVTNLSEDASENDLMDLFRPFGSIARVYVGRDREQNRNKGFAYVSFHDKEAAQRAIEGVNGHGFDNLILHVEMAGERKKP